MDAATGELVEKIVETLNANLERIVIAELDRRAKERLPADLIQAILKDAETRIRTELKIGDKA